MMKYFVALSFLFLGLYSQMDATEEKGKQAHPDTSIPTYISHPLLQKGVLDLTHWDLEAKGNVRLDGEWEFYYQEFYTSKDFQNVKHPFYLKLPGYWSNGNHQNYSNLGYATYRAIIHIAESDLGKSIGLYIPHAFTSYKLFINGRLIARNGNPGKTNTVNHDFWLPQAAFFTLEKNPIEIVIHVANYKSAKAGFRQSIEMGTEQSILQYKQMLLAMDLFLIGCILIISLYHFGIYLLRRQESYLLYFSLYSLMLLPYKMATGEYFLMMLFPELDFLWMTRIFHLSIFLAVPFFSLFVNQLYKEESSPVIAKGLQIIFFTMAVFLPLAGIGWLEDSLTIAEILIVLVLLQSIDVFRKAIQHKRVGAIGFLAGFAFFFLTIINDILFEKDIIHTEIYTPVGFFVLIFSQSFFLARRFTYLFATVEEQREELEKTSELKEKLYNSSVFAKRMELELLKRTIQPHFLMNSLVAIRCYLIENKEKSIRLLDALTGELRIILQFSDKKFISIQDEIQLCRHHLSVMEIRREKPYSLKVIGIEGDEVIPPMIFHTILENAFTHEDSSENKLSFGLMKKRKRIEEKDYIIYFFSILNLNSRETGQKRKGSGMGLKYIRTRLEEAWPGKWKISHGKSRNGYRVIIQIQENAYLNR